MKFKFILGVDMSKDWFNFCLMNAQFDIFWESQIDNNPDSIFSFLTALSQRNELLDTQTTLAQVVLVMEHTGLYVNHLVNAYLGKGGPLTLVHASKVSDLLGGKQKWDEKTDQMDARRLAEYGFRYSDKLELWKAKDHTLVKLQALQRQRTRLINVLNILEVPVKESIDFASAALSEMLVNNQKASVIVLKNDLKNVENQLKQLIELDPHLKQLFKLITSVPGAGPVIAREVIITTSAFKDFLPTQAKKYARYVSVIPKDKQTGKSKRRKKTSKRGNKNLRSLLTMGATALIGHHSDLGLYYTRKRAEGKEHFSVINAMRNKLILRIFAVVRNQVMYEKNLNLSIN